MNSSLALRVGVCRSAPTNQARLFGHELDVLLVTKAARLRMGKSLVFVNAIGGGCPAGPTGCRASDEDGGWGVGTGANG